MRTLDDIQKEIWRLNDMKKRVGLSEATKLKIAKEIKQLREIMRTGMKNTPVHQVYNKL
ncbi:hypothetical protein [Flexithrix dorotheae]|uniref:hypothetical protein n=1 Tax=Flexithrix dorotheae TaxID=70993 RepID=UPI00037CD107|nr:hypothetical protein [Flexithrix dorotheae]